MAPTIATIGELVAQEVTRMAQKPDLALRQLSNAQPGDRTAFARSAHALLALGRELDQVDTEISKASNGELASKFRHSGPLDGHLSELMKRRWRIEGWAERNLPADSRDGFERLSKRYFTLLDDLSQGNRDFAVTCRDIIEAFRKDQIIQAAAAMDPKIAQHSSELELEQVNTASQAAAALSSALDEAYEIAEAKRRPLKLQSLDSAADSPATGDDIPLSQSL